MIDTLGFLFDALVERHSCLCVFGSEVKTRDMTGTTEEAELALVSRELPSSFNTKSSITLDDCCRMVFSLAVTHFIFQRKIQNQVNPAAVLHFHS